MKIHRLQIVILAMMFAFAWGTALSAEPGAVKEGAQNSPDASGDNKEPREPVAIDKAEEAAGEDGDETQDLESAIKEIMKQAAPAVVHVSFNIEQDAGKRKIEGCGVIVSEEGHVLLDAEDFTDSYSRDQFVDFEIQLETENGPRTQEAEYMGKDPASGMAVLKLKPSDEGGDFGFVTFSYESEPELGEELVVVGYMGKDYNYKRDFRTGRVCAVIEKPVKLFAITPSAAHVEYAVIFNLEGEALGVLKKLSSGGPSRGGFTFTFGGMRMGGGSGGPKPVILYPASHFKKVIDNPPTPEAEKPKAWLAVMGLQNLSKELAEYWNLGEDTKGVIVGHVIKAGPGEKIGLKAEDVILKLNGQSLETDQGNAVSALNERLKKLEAGEKISLTVYRGGAEVELRGELGEEPKSVGKARKVKFEDEFKFTVRELVFFDLYNRDLPVDHDGCMVHFIESGWAADGGLSRGDIITRVDGDCVKDVVHFEKLFNAAVDKNPRDIILSVLRGSTNESVIVRIECHWK